MLNRFDLNKTYQCLLLLLAFLLPLTVFGANLIIAIIVVIWFCSGNYKSKIYQITSSKILISSIIFFLLHIIGLLWTTDIEWGLHITHKMWYFFILLPVLYCITSKNFIQYYLYAFIAAILLTEVVSYLVWFEFIAPFKNATLKNPTPFMSHISFNPILAFAIYIIAYKIFFDKNLDKILLYLYSFFIVAMSITMFLTHGRAGQVMYFFVIIVLTLQYFRSQKIKALLLLSILIPLIFFIAYYFFDAFSERIDQAIMVLFNYSEMKSTSVGQRISFALNSIEVIKDNLIFGVGTGDFVIEYDKAHYKNTPEIISTTNPHNMYILVGVQLGLVGLVSFISIFYYQLRFGIQNQDTEMRDFGVFLPFFFMILMLSDSYLLGHYTSLLFVFFSSFIYKDFEHSS